MTRDDDLAVVLDPCQKNRAAVGEAVPAWLESSEPGLMLQPQILHPVRHFQAGG
jgi:hypothetical protein